jgi:hypothetical protein
VALAALGLGLGLGSGEARAASSDSWNEPEPELAEPDPPSAPPEPSYASVLTVAYTLAPLLAIPAGAALFELTDNDTVAVVGAGLAVVSVPVLTHVAYGQAGRGAVTALLLPAITVGALAVGGVSGYFLGKATCESDSDCELSNGLGGGLLGGLAGGLLGYVIYAVYDVNEHSSLERSEATGADVRVWALPVSGRRRDEQVGATRLSGAMVGATLTF